MLYDCGLYWGLDVNMIVPVRPVCVPILLVQHRILSGHLWRLHWPLKTLLCLHSVSSFSSGIIPSRLPKNWALWSDTNCTLACTWNSPLQKLLDSGILSVWQFRHLQWRIYNETVVLYQMRCIMVSSLGDHRGSHAFEAERRWCDVQARPKKQLAGCLRIFFFFSQPAGRWASSPRILQEVPCGNQKFVELQMSKHGAMHPRRL